MKFERRAVETNYKQDENKLIGYAAVWNTASEIYERGKKFWEKIVPYAFRNSLAENKDIICTFNHNPNYVLGRTSSGTLKLQEDEKGLYYEVQLDERIERHREIKYLAERGDLNGCSFTFEVRENGESWDGNQRSLTELDIYELGPVTIPAYKDTVLGTRSEDKPEKNLELYKYKLKLREKFQS